jgi:membrane-associated phospholipid phosphatase
MRALQPIDVTAAGTASPRLATFSLFIVGTIYISSYWLLNRITHARNDVGSSVFAWEQAIPFVEWTIVPYLSIVLFFMASFFVGQRQSDYRNELKNHLWRLIVVLVISLVCFALVPRYTFERPATTGFTGLLFAALQAFDMPYNRAPSLHISVLLILWVRFSACVFGWLRVVIALWFAVIGVSVLTTYQHHVIDVVAGVFAGCFCLRAANPVLNFASRLFDWRLKE